MTEKLKKISIVTDSVANIPGELVKKYDIRVVPLYVTIDGASYREVLEISPQEVYDALLSGSQVKSSTPTVEDFTDVYKDIRENTGSEMIYSIHLSSVLSGTINAATAAVRSIEGIDVRIVDSRMAAIGEGFVVLSAANAAKEGAEPSEIDSIIEKTRASSFFYATFDNFEYLVKGGRAPFLAEFVKRVMIIKAVISFKDSGSLGLKKFCLNKKSSIKALLDLVKKDIATSGIEDCFIGICYGNDDGTAERLKKMIRDDSNIRAANIVMTRMTSVMAAHTGPGIWGIAACPAFVSSL